MATSIPYAIKRKVSKSSRAPISAKKKKAKAKEEFGAKYGGHFEPFNKIVQEFNDRTRKVESVTILSLRFKYGSDLCETLQEITSSDAFYDSTPEIAAMALLPHIHALSAGMSNRNGTAQLVAFIRNYAEKDLTVISRMMESGEISFGNLWYIFKKGDKITLNVDGALVGAKVSECRYYSSFFGESFAINYTYITNNGTKFAVVSDNASIPAFRGTKKIASLPVQPLGEHEEAALVKRGKQYCEITAKASHLEYAGNMICKAGWSEAYFVADGRCMVDLLSYRRMNPNSDDDSRDGRELFDTVPEDMLFMCSAWVYGFSLKIKRWGRFCVDNLKPVIFNDSAFDTLVLKKPETKELILALIENTKFSFQDVIQGKGGGCIMLLYGNPGVGKTLTAESTAEHQHRPLYSVSVGELGTNPETLEEHLRRILEMATIWGAVVLIDEADIFLEHRDDDADIARNAMVAIFLRMLEYHQGLLYLTTNRVKSFDPAFFSRISVAIRYDDFNISDRIQVWNNLLDAAKIEKTHIDIAHLAGYNINGRQIKNAIRIGQSLARSEGKPVTALHMERTIRYTESFLKELEADQKK